MKEIIGILIFIALVIYCYSGCIADKNLVVQCRSLKKSANCTEHQYYCACGCA